MTKEEAVNKLEQYGEIDGDYISLSTVVIPIIEQIDEPTNSEKPNNWHKVSEEGLLKEEGLYLTVRYDSNNCLLYVVNYLNCGRWVNTGCWIAWQKIDPYEEG